jgi:hypothetical protein
MISPVGVLHRISETRWIVPALLLCLSLSGCASFRKPYGQMTEAEQAEARSDQADLWDFLSGGHLEDMKER